MSVEHKRPLYAFIAIAIVVGVVLGYDIRTNGVGGLLRPTVPMTVVAGNVFVPAHADPVKGSSGRSGADEAPTAATLTRQDTAEASRGTDRGADRASDRTSDRTSDLTKDLAGDPTGRADRGSDRGSDRRATRTAIGDRAVMRRAEGLRAGLVHAHGRHGLHARHGRHAGWSHARMVPADGFGYDLSR